MKQSNEGNYQDEAWDEIVNELKREAVHFASQDGNIEEVKRLISEGYAVSAFDTIGKTPLHYAAMEEHIEVARYLIEAGADVNANDDEWIGNTPLGEVAGSCSFAMAKLLIDAGADPTIRGWMQLNALDRAEKRKKPEGRKVYELLLHAAKRV